MEEQSGGAKVPIRGPPTAGPGEPGARCLSEAPPPQEVTRRKRNTMVAACSQGREASSLRHGQQPRRLAGSPRTRGAGTAFQGTHVVTLGWATGVRISVSPALSCTYSFRDPDWVCSKQRRPHRHAAWLCDFPFSAGCPRCKMRPFPQSGYICYSLSSVLDQ